MKIYKISHDIEKYEFLVPITDNDFDLIKNFKSGINKQWTIPNWHLIERDKKKKLNSTNFNASCYYSGYLMMEASKANLLKKMAEELIDLYPINISGMNNNFFYIHINKIINSIKQEQLLNWDYSKVENAELKFDQHIINNYLIFNDEILDYLCRHEFIEFCKENEILGLSFKEVGKEVA